MSQTFHVALPPVLFVLMVLWVAGGMWMERKSRVGGGSLIVDAITFLAGLMWFLGLVVLMCLFGGSLAGLFYKLFIEP